MSRTLIGACSAAFVVLIAAIFVVAAGASKDSKPGTVAVGQSKLGRILVDSRGRTLYLFEKDKRGMSSCNGACVANWPPLIAIRRPTAGSGVKAALLGRSERRDGRWQVTYDRHPLYRFVQDTKKGDTRGEGLDFFGGEWYAVSPAGLEVDEDDSHSDGYGWYSY